MHSRSHFVVEHTTAEVDFRQVRAKRLFFKLRLDVACRFDSSEPLVLNGVNFKDVRVEGASKFAYDGFLLSLWLDLKRGQHKTLSVSYSVINPVCGVKIREPNFYVCCDFEAHSARYCFLSQDAPIFASTWELHLRAAKELTRLGVGLLIDEIEHEDGSVTSIWRQEKPLPVYVVSFLVGELIRVGENLIGDRVFEEQTILRTFNKAPSIRTFLENKFGPFPCAKIYHCLVDISTGMENESLIVVRGFFLFFFFSLFSFSFLSSIQQDMLCLATMTCRDLSGMSIEVLLKHEKKEKKQGV
jgi:hypothetical protein